VKVFLFVATTNRSHRLTFRSGRMSLKCLRIPWTRGCPRRPTAAGRICNPPEVRRRECSIIDHPLVQMAMVKRVVTWSRGLVTWVERVARGWSKFDQSIWQIVIDRNWQPKAAIDHQGAALTLMDSGAMSLDCVRLSAPFARDPKGAVNFCCWREVRKREPASASVPPRLRCGTRLPLTCLRTARTFAPCRSCSDTAALKPP
jgi:hypothetical protein